MSISMIVRPHGRRRFRILAAVFSAAIFATGLSAVVLESASTSASAAMVSFSQCNGHEAGPAGAALTVACSVNIINTIDATGGTSTVVFNRVCTLDGCTGDIASPSDVINAVHQCNNSDNGGGSTTVCSVNIVNNISRSAPAAATAITVNQCNGSGAGGGGNITACIPSSQGSPTVTQCNGSGNGGGAMMTCNASGTSSSDFPVTVDQCNGSENGGGSTVTCTVSMTTNIIDTSAKPDTPPTGTPGGPDTGGGTGGPSAGTPGTGTPGTGTDTGIPSTGTPGTGTPGTPGTPASPPFVEVPPNYTG